MLISSIPSASSVCLPINGGESIFPLITIILVGTVRVSFDISTLTSSITGNSFFKSFKFNFRSFNLHFRHLFLKVCELAFVHNIRIRSTVWLSYNRYPVDLYCTCFLFISVILAGVMCLEMVQEIFIVT